jgi:hypothetical protein
VRGRHPWLLLLPLLVVYVAAAFLFPNHPDDEAAYVELAHRLVDGRYVAGDEDALLDDDPVSPDLWFGPGAPAVLAPLAAVDAPIEVFRLVGPLALFGGMLCFYALARERWGARVALVSTYALGSYPPFLALLPNVHGEPPAIFFASAAMLGVSRMLGRGGSKSFVMTAAALAALALTRVAYGWVLTVVLFLLLMMAFVRRPDPVALRSAKVVALALLLCVPWLAYTAAKTGRPLVWGNSGSLSLYWMSSPYDGDSGDWRQANDVFTDPELAPHRSFFASLRGLSLAEQNAEIEREAIGNIVDHPLAYAGNVAANGSRLLVNAPYSDSRWKANDLFYALPNAVLVAAIALSIVVLTRRRRRLPPETLPLTLLATVAVLAHLLVAGYPRMLAPIAPLVAWFTTLALVEAGILTAAPREPEARAGMPPRRATA